MPVYNKCFTPPGYGHFDAASLWNFQRSYTTMKVAFIAMFDVPAHVPAHVLRPRKYYLKFLRLLYSVKTRFCNINISVNVWSKSINVAALALPFLFYRIQITEFFVSIFILIVATWYKVMRLQVQHTFREYWWLSFWRRCYRG